MVSPAGSLPQPPHPPGIAELIREAQERPPQPVLEGLLNESEIAGLHGLPESFKTVLTLQLAEAIATGEPFLNVWKVPQPKTVYFFETEMSVAALGTRLAKMYQEHQPPHGVVFATEEQLKQFRRASGVPRKFELLDAWIRSANADVVIVDTANPFFRGKDSPNDETTVGAFFEHLSSLRSPTKFFVRHNRKPRMEDLDEGPSRIRGSGQFVDWPDLLLEIRRKDKRTNEAELEVTKFRHGTKPENLKLWFDARDVRLISIPPVIRLLQDGPLSRAELLARLQKRFGVEQRKGDDQINDQRPFLRESHRGHSLLFEINREAAQSAEWYSRIAQAEETIR